MHLKIHFKEHLIKIHLNIVHLKMHRINDKSAPQTAFCWYLWVIIIWVQKWDTNEGMHWHTCWVPVLAKYGLSQWWNLLVFSYETVRIVSVHTVKRRTNTNTLSYFINTIEEWDAAHTKQDKVWLINALQGCKWKYSRQIFWHTYRKYVHTALWDSRRSY